jgi:plasmid stabilization system protein ParE
MARHYGWLAAEAGSDIAERFMSAADSAFAELSQNAGLGAAVGSRNPRLVQLRKWRIDGFSRMNAFYISDENAIRLLRVLHTAQD